VSIGLGIGANTAIFSLLDALLTDSGILRTAIQQNRDNPAGGEGPERAFELSRRTG
jgi:hypothetical protein